jgi:hypothetical protein
VRLVPEAPVARSDKEAGGLNDATEADRRSAPSFLTVALQSSALWTRTRSPVRTGARARGFRESGARAAQALPGLLRSKHRAGVFESLT